MSDQKSQLLRKKIQAELRPFLNSIRNRKTSRELLKKAYTDYKSTREHADAIRAFIIHGLFKETTEVKDVIHSMFTYLGFVETEGNNVVNVAVMILVASGIDFHIERYRGTPRIRHAVTIADLEEERVPLTIKLNFLREAGVTELASVVDSELRNAIAHLRVTIEENKIFIKIGNRKKAPRPMLTESIVKLMVASRTVRELLDDYFSEL